MGATGSRHGIAAGLAVAVVLLVAALAPTPAAASSAGGLYSISGDQRLIQLNPITGAETTIADLSVSGLPQFGFEVQLGNIATDPINQRLIVERSIIEFDVQPQIVVETRFLSVDASSKTLTVGPTVAQPLERYAYDSGSGSIVGTTACCNREVLRVDLATGAETHIAFVSGDQLSTEAIDPATHTLFVASSSLGSFPPVTSILSISLQTPDSVFTSPTLATGVVGLTYDTSSRTLIGGSFLSCCGLDWSLFKINPTTGAENTIAQIPNSQIIGSTTTVDPNTHTVYVVNSVLDATGGQFTYILSINEQNGSVMTSQAVPELFLGTMSFLSTVITSDTVKAQIQAAVASGAIDNAGVAASLLAELRAAASASAAGHCATAARLYSAFINDVSAQSGKHVAPATAGQLVSEAQVLMGSCP